MYDLVRQTREDVALIKAKIDAIPDQERRIRSLEKWRYSLPAGVLTAIVVSVTSLLGVIFGHGA